MREIICAHDLNEKDHILGAVKWDCMYFFHPISHDQIWISYKHNMIICFFIIKCLSIKPKHLVMKWDFSFTWLEPGSLQWTGLWKSDGGNDHIELCMVSYRCTGGGKFGLESASTSTKSCIQEIQPWQYEGWKRDEDNRIPWEKPQHSFCEQVSDKIWTHNSLQMLEYQNAFAQKY